MFGLCVERPPFIIGISVFMGSFQAVGLSLTQSASCYSLLLIRFLIHAAFTLARFSPWRNLGHSWKGQYEAAKMLKPSPFQTNLTSINSFLRWSRSFPAKHFNEIINLFRIHHWFYVLGVGDLLWKSRTDCEPWFNSSTDVSGWSHPILSLWGDCGFPETHRKEISTHYGAIGDLHVRIKKYFLPNLVNHKISWITIT